MAGNGVVHVWLKSLTGLVRCERCQTLWSYQRTAAEFEQLQQHRSRCCGAPIAVLTETTLAIVAIRSAAAAPPADTPEKEGP